MSWPSQWNNANAGFTGGIQTSPDHMKLMNMVGSCMQTGSYTTNPAATELAKNILTSLKQKSPSLSVEMGKYS